jgi:hypothetical protein
LRHGHIGSFRSGVGGRVDTIVAAFELAVRCEPEHGGVGVTADLRSVYAATILFVARLRVLTLENRISDGTFDEDAVIARMTPYIKGFMDVCMDYVKENP